MPRRFAFYQFLKQSAIALLFHSDLTDVLLLVRFVRSAVAAAHRDISAARGEGWPKIRGWPWAQRSLT
jgi:hypothetical protein